MSPNPAAFDWNQFYSFVLALAAVGSALAGGLMFFLRKSFVTIGRFEALERRVETCVAESAFDELEKRVSHAERAQDGNASAKELSFVALALEKLNGTTGRLEERLSGMAERFNAQGESVARIEDYLLKERRP